MAYGTGMVVPGYDPRPAALAEAERKRKEQEEIDRLYVAGKGKVGTTGPTPGWDAINKVNAMPPYQGAMTGLTTAYRPPTTSTAPVADPNQSFRDTLERQNALRETTKAERERMAYAAKLQAEADARKYGYERETTGRAAKLQEDAEARRMAMVKGLLPGSTPTSDTSAITAGNTDEARANIYARAKDNIGLATRGAIDSLRNQFAGTGNFGGQRSAIGGVVGTGAGQIGNVVRDQSINELDMLAGREKEERAAALTKRQQDMSILPSLYGLITARGVY